MRRECGDTTGLGTSNAAYRFSFALKFGPNNPILRTRAQLRKGECTPRKRCAVPTQGTNNNSRNNRLGFFFHLKGFFVHLKVLISTLTFGGFFSTLTGFFFHLNWFFFPPCEGGLSLGTRSGTRSGPDRDQIGTRSGPDLDQIWTRSGPDLALKRTRL